MRSSWRAVLAPWSGAEGCQGDGLQQTGSKPNVLSAARRLRLEAWCDQFFPQPFGVRGRRRRAAATWPGVFRATLLKGLILAQNERWRRGLGMQVERAWQQVSGARVSKATVTNPMVGYSRGKLRVIPSDVPSRHRLGTKAPAPWDGPLWY